VTMSGTTIAITVEGVLLAGAIVFVVALLRSHAEILRRLHALEGGAPTPDPLAATSDEVPTEIAGQTLGGDAVKLSLSGGSRTLLAFLSSGCASCGPLWDGARTGAPVPAGTRLVVVTKGRDRESPTRLERLGASPDVLMSTEVWDAFAIPATPHFVLVDGAGRLAGRGSAGSWEQILGLLADADADGARAAQDTSARAARAEAALAAAGIGAGHPSLYPSREDGP
jgi:hypothetical protein